MFCIYHPASAQILTAMHLRCVTPARGQGWQKRQPATINTYIASVASSQTRVAASAGQMLTTGDMSQAFSCRFYAAHGYRTTFYADYIHRGPAAGIPAPSSPPPEAPARDARLKPKIRPPQRVPQAVYHEWSAAVEHGIHAVENAPNDAARETALTRLVMLPSTCLCVRMGKGRHKRIIALLRQFRGEQPGTRRDPDDEVPEPRAPRRATAYTQAHRIHTYIQKANISRGAQQLDALPLAEITPSSTQQFRALHPDAQPPTFSDADTQAPELRLEDVRVIIESLTNGKASGLSGWSYEHIKAAICTPSGLEAGHAFLKLILAGTLPRLPDMLDSNDIALQKPDGGIRPIAVGEAWTRLGAICALRAHPDLGFDLAPLQLGVGIPGGAECVGHMLRAALQEDPNTHVISLDCTNAFNTVSRQAIANTVHTKAPTLIPFIRWAYGEASRVFLSGAPDDVPPIVFAAGVRQGVPLGPLLFALTLLPALEATRAEHPQAGLVAYMDDVHVVGLANPATLACTTLREEVGKIGLTPNPAKSKVYSPDVDSTAAAAETLGIQHARDGLVAAGTPIGSDAFVQQFVETRRQEARKLIEKLLACPSPITSVQDKWMVLTRSLQQRMLHLGRTIPWEQAGPALERHDADIIRAALHLFDLENPTAHGLSELAVVRQMHLPLKFGGFALHPFTRDVCSAAFLSCAARTQLVVQSAAQHFQPLRSAPIRTKWEELAGLYPVVPPPPPADAPAERLLDCPQPVRDAYNTACYEQQHTELPDATDRTRLHSLASRPGNMWLDTLPTIPKFCIPDQAFQDNARMNLGIRTFTGSRQGWHCPAPPTCTATRSPTPSTAPS